MRIYHEAGAGGAECRGLRHGSRRQILLSRQAVLLHRDELLVRAAFGVAGRDGRPRTTGERARLFGGARDEESPETWTFEIQSHKLAAKKYIIISG